MTFNPSQHPSLPRASAADCRPPADSSLPSPAVGRGNRSRWHRLRRRALLAAWIGSLFGGAIAAVPTATPAVAQVPSDACCFAPSYRLQTETVMQPQTVQRYRLVRETDYREEEIVSYRPVLKTRTEQREVRVARPVTETSYREERYTVQIPVTETSYRDESYTETTYVTETTEREESVTTMRPVTETQMVQRQHVVQRPVVETQMYQQQYMVQRPVTETQMVQQQYQVQRPVTETQLQTQQHVVQRPVTTITNQVVETGGYVNQQVVQPGQVRYGLQWVPRAVQTTGPLGIFSVNRGAAVWTPTVTPPTVQNQLVFQSNPVTQQVAQTSYVNEVQQTQVPVQVTRMQNELVTQQVPVQVTRMQNEMVTQQVPVQVTRMQSETVTEQLPVQTTRMVPMVETRRVPVTTQRPVTETKTRRVPTQQTRWVSEERVRRVPVTCTRIEYETRMEPHEVRYYEQERVVQTVRRPVVTEKYVPYTETILVPRQVVQRVPLSYYDPFAPAILQGYSTLAPASSSTPSDSAADPLSSYGSSVTTPPDHSSDDGTVSAARQPLDENGSSPAADQDQLKPRVGNVESTPPQPTTSDSQPSAAAGGLPGVLNAPQRSAADGTTGSEAGKAAGETNQEADERGSDGNSNGTSQQPAASDYDELLAPALDGDTATYRIRYRPRLLHEI